LRNAVGGHFSYQAATAATENLQSEAWSRLEITFDRYGEGGGPKLHYAGDIAATAFTKSLPGLKARETEIQETIRTIRDSYHHATLSMHVLLILFLWDRFA
jgi:hypothetical protein